MFDAAAEHVYTLLLKKDSYPRFIRSEHYKDLLVNGVQAFKKQRFLIQTVQLYLLRFYILNVNLLHLQKNVKVFYYDCIASAFFLKILLSFILEYLCFFCSKLITSFISAHT